MTDAKFNNNQGNTMNCELCGEPMPEGESMFKFHGYSGPCPKPPLRRAPASSNAWRTVIEDELICAHLGTVDSFPDAKSALQNLIDWHVSVALDPAVSSKAQALVDRGKAAQPAEPVAWDAALNTLAQVFHNGEEAEGDDGAVMMVDLALWNEGCEALESLVSEDELAAPPAPVPPEPIAEMDAVAIRYAHKMALDLECILAEYGGSWYNTAMQTLGEYRSEMNAIHERESPTFMGEPLIAAGDKS